MLVENVFNLAPREDQFGKLLIGRETVNVNENSTTSIRMSCIVRGPCDIFSASCIISCAICLIRERVNYLFYMYELLNCSNFK